MSLARAVESALSVGVVVALAAYPLLVYAAVGRFGANGAAVTLAVLCVARLAVLRLRGRPAFGGAYLDWLCVGGVLLAAIGFYLGNAGAVRYYPVLANAALFVVFGSSLKRPPTVVERIARLREPDLPPAAVAYTRRVTIVWTIFFVLNGVGLLIQVVCTGFTYYTLGLHGGVAYNASLLAGVAFGAAFRYWSYKKWVFTPAVA